MVIMALEEDTPMLETRFIPRLGGTVTRLGLGALPMGPLQRALSVEAGARVVRAAVEGGITFIDTATLYGTYEHLARGLQGWGGAVTLATKTHARADRALAEQHIETALKELNREVIDIMLCHCARHRFTEDEWGPTLEALLAARDRGLIRMVGLSTHSVAGVLDAVGHPEMDVVHPLINLQGMGIIDGGVDEMVAAIREAHRAGMFVYAMKSLAGGNFVPNREEALRFIFGIDEIDAAVVGMVTPQEVEWNLRFAAGRPIPEALARDTSLSSKRLSIVALACEGCGECVEHCENDALSIVDGKACVDYDRCILCGYCAPHCPRLAIRMV
jgi:aryl-alcohol dehydrogenase-like predicted oxidoreductase/NAD-dependent dihydropyrimidine dehydrogenase PreA subunit